MSVTSLRDAAHKGNRAVVQHHLEQGTDIDRLNEALVEASSAGHSDVVKLLLLYVLGDGAQVTVDALDNDGVSSLILASLHGHSDVVKLLLDNGAQVHLQDNDGKFSLIRASRKGHSDVVKLLLDNGAQVDLQDNDGVSSLIGASIHGHSDVVKLLLDNGAQVDLQDSDRKSSLIRASQNGHSDVVKLLLDNGAQVDLQDNDGKSSLIRASRNGLSDVVKLLQGNGAQVDLQDNGGVSSLIGASLHGHSDVVKLLVDNGAQVDLQDNDGKSSLIGASLNGHSDVVKLLLDYDAQVNLQDKGGVSSLIGASLHGHRDVVKLLVDNGAQVDLQDNDGKSSLIIARRNGHSDVVKLLSDVASKSYLLISSTKRPDDPTLNIADILDRLIDVLDRYYEIGIMLHLRTSALNSIRTRSTSDVMAMSSVIDEWLKRMYDTDRFGPPTWKMLMEVVANPNGGNNKRVAEEMADWHRIISGGDDTHTSESQDQAPSQEFSSTKRPALSTSTDDTTLSDDTNTSESTLQRNEEISSTKKLALSTDIDNPTLNFIGEITIHYRTEAIDHKWKDHGFRLCIPDNALPHGVTDCHIDIKGALSCEYEVPHASEEELVSGVYLVNTTHSFTKPVAIHIQRSAGNIESLRSGSGSGHLSSGSSYGSITVNSFSLFGAFSDFKKIITSYLRPDYRYLSSLYYTECKSMAELRWDVYFVIIKDSDLYQELIKQYFLESNIAIQYSKSVTYPIYFAEDKYKITLDFQDGEIVSGNWKLQPAVHPEISRDAVNSFRSGQYPPMCKLYLTCSNSSSPAFEHHLSLQGAQGSNNCFNMTMHVPSQISSTERGTDDSTLNMHHRIISDDTHTLESQDQAPSISSTKRPSPSTDTSTDATFTYLNVRQALQGIVSKWGDLGEVLGLSHNVVESIKVNCRQNVEECLKEVIKKWLEGKGSPSWKSLCKALRNPLVSRYDLASRIEQTYPGLEDMDCI